MTKYAGGTDSVAEAAFWVALERVKDCLPCATQIQHTVSDGSFSTRVDFAWPDEKVIVQIDGRDYHTDSKTFTRDRQKQRLFTDLGWRHAPFAAHEVLGDADYCVRELFRIMDWPYPEVLPPRPGIDPAKQLDAPAHALHKEVVEVAQVSSVQIKRRWTNLRTQ